MIYTKSSENNPYFSTVEAVGMDMNGNTLWTRTLNSSQYSRSLCRNTTGFNLGQNIAAWVNCVDGGLYAQNILPDGTMGIPVPVDSTGIAERTNDIVVNVINVFNMLGQIVKATNLNELTPGIYILQGLTEEGRLVNQKVLINRN